MGGSWFVLGCIKEIKLAIDLNLGFKIAKKQMKEREKRTKESKQA